MDHALCVAMLVHDVQRRLEELEHCILALEQEPRGPEEPSISDSEAVSDGDDEHYETEGPRLAERPIVQQKVKHGHLTAGGGAFSRVPNVTEFMTYRPCSQEVLVDLVSNFGKSKGKLGKLWQLAFCDSRTQEWAEHPGGGGGGCGFSRKEVEGWHARHHFESIKTQKGA